MSRPRALVTGASRGIGAAIAVELARAGHPIIINYRSQEAAALEVKARIEAEGGTAELSRFDVAARDAVTAALAALDPESRPIGVLVNNAGIARDGLIFNLKPEDWLDVMRVNFGGVFNCTKAAMPHFMGQREGAIVNVSSVMGERGWIGESNYAASKGAVNSFTRCAAVELARFGVRVNAVLPGFAPTDLVAGLIAKDGGKSIKRQIPMKDFATVEQVAQTVTFLASPDSSYMTGAFITVDGGTSATLGVGAPL